MVSCLISFTKSDNLCCLIQLQRGGFLLVPHTFQFFKSQQNWLSDCVRFRRLSNNDATSSIDETLTHPGDHGWLLEQVTA